MIVSRNGFQAGAYAAAQQTNIKLIDWFQFQEIFEERWKIGRYDSVSAWFDELFLFYDYPSAPIGNAIQRGGKEALEEFEQIQRRYTKIAGANSWGQIGQRNFPPDLPLTVDEIDPDGSTRSVRFIDYASLFDWYETQARQGLAEFRNFLDRYMTGPTEYS